MAEVKKDKKISKKLKKEYNQEAEITKDISKNSKNLVDVESDNQLIERIKKMYLPNIEFNKKTLQFYYNQKIKDSNDVKYVNYRNILRENLANALGIRVINKQFKTLIHMLDNDNEKLIRGDILNRLMQYYKLLVEFGLDLIHTNLYLDDTTQEFSFKYGINDAISMAAPIIVRLKNQMEEWTQNEFNFSEQDLKILKR